MLTADDFRRLALSLNDAIESAHMGHPDFRANGRIFATLRADDKWGMVKLTPEEQRAFMRGNPETFVPSSGAWGRQGCTDVRLESTDEATIRAALLLAWTGAAAKPRARTSSTTGKPGARRSPALRATPQRRSRRS